MAGYLEYAKSTLKLRNPFTWAPVKPRDLPQRVDDPETHRNPFLDLPNELILAITDFLETKFRLSLRISCRRFRVLNDRLDMSQCDNDTKS
ncbi:hypothetical protein A1O7_06570 [Cladophialophora yegresii CBS 114405]|uniref:F-box domain-containing protein n=1 Tax=Cladophialophora yegresii CBS 114405 TaxID=1182544 RepID=W9WKZ8_9EURO|nr:uncharacterized protein A1O7_06570 [Cladophialophora yegresii CBS 114405]EXJ59139.1 hypothetical protein A1O7_06570 [Cladophialophora yegresii CBS 114405]